MSYYSCKCGKEFPLLSQIVYHAASCSDSEKTEDFKKQLSILHGEIVCILKNAEDARYSLQRSDKDILDLLLKQLSDF